MKIIHCHPDNKPALEAALHRNELALEAALHRNELVGVDAIGAFARLEFTIRTSKHVPKDKPTGRYVLPSGRVVERDQINLRHKFVIYGPEDADLLVYMKYIQEEREMHFYVTDDSFRVRMAFEPMIFDRVPMIHQTA